MILVISVDTVPVIVNHSNCQNIALEELIEAQVSIETNSRSSSPSRFRFTNDGFICWERH